MRAVKTLIGFAVLLLILAGVWVAMLHPDWIKLSKGEDEEIKPETEVAVRTAKVVRATLRGYVEAYGAVEPEPAMAGKPAASASVVAPVQGVIAQVLCEVGQRVEQGDVLFQLDDRLGQAQAAQAQAALESSKASLAKLKATPRPEQVEIAQLTLLKAKGTLELAERNCERQRKLAEQTASAKIIEAAENERNIAGLEVRAAETQLSLLKASPTPEELAEAEAKVREAEQGLGMAQAQRSLLTVKSPIGGTVLRVAVNAGEAADTGKALADLAAMDRLIVNATVSSRELPLLKVGISAEINAANAREAAPVQGVVKWIGQHVDRKSDTVQVWVGVPAGAGLMPGQFVRVRLVCEERPGRLAVPRPSVYTDHDGQSTLSIVEGGKAIQKVVKAGLCDGELIEVEGEGVTEGATVVTLGSYALPKETKVHVLNSQQEAK